jgi:hypothetical protein
MLVGAFYTLNDFMFLANKAEHLLADVDQIIIVQLLAMNFLFIHVGVVSAAQILQKEFAFALTIGLHFDDGVMLADKVIQDANIILFRTAADAD